MNKKEELDAMLAAVDALAKQMKRKLKMKARDGFSGGLKPESERMVRKLLREHVRRLCWDEPRQAIDVANLAMMLWVIGGAPKAYRTFQAQR